ncbi:MAG: hypothetical protein R3B48_22125 [Kofleriaceae bacterium]
MSLRGASVLAVSMLACGGGEAPLPPLEALDAGAGPIPEPGVSTLPTFDPASAAHLDREDRPATPPSTARLRNRTARTLGIMLRSTPKGAIAAVDGVPVGPTPTYWEGEFTGQEREFTFALVGHAVARYRFTPVTSGVVHGSLEPIATAPGAGPPPIPRPSVAPVAPPPVAPPSPRAAPESGSSQAPTPRPTSEDAATATDVEGVQPPPPASLP